MVFEVPLPMVVRHGSQTPVYYQIGNGLVYVASSPVVRDLPCSRKDSGHGHSLDHTMTVGLVVQNTTSSCSGDSILRGGWSCITLEGELPLL